MSKRRCVSAGRLAPVLALVLMAAGCATSTESNPSLAVREVGSFHVGGREVTLSGLPEKELVFTPGAPPFRVNPNGDIEVEQMYVQYVTLDPAARKGRYPLLMWQGGGLSAVPHLFLWGDYLDRQPLWAGISRNQRGYVQAWMATKGLLR